MHGGTSLGQEGTQGPPILGPTQDRLLQGLILDRLLLVPTRAQLPLVLILAQLPLELILAQLPPEPSQGNLGDLEPIPALLGPILLLAPMVPPLDH